MMFSFRFSSFGFLLATVFIFNLALDSSENKIAMLRDLDTIRSVFANRYAPAEWKKAAFGWDLDAEIEKAKTRLLENDDLTVKDYQLILKDFFISPRDHHVEVHFYSTEMAQLPFYIKSAEGKYFFVYIDKAKLSPSVYPIEVGDELVLFDGHPTIKAINEIKKHETSTTNEATDDAYAEMNLTMRLGMFGHIVPRGPIDIQVRHKATDKLSNYQIIWEYTPEKITSNFSLIKDFRSSPRSENISLLNHPIFNKQIVPPRYEALKAVHPAKDCSHFLGSKKSFVPKLGHVWWTAPSSSRFHGYLFETVDHKLIGYVRIPSYQNPDTAALTDFADIIDLFEARADALIIDQVNNPGGSLFYLYALASMLTDQPLKTPKHRMKISQSDLFYGQMMIPMLENVNSDEEAQIVLGPLHEGNPVTFQMAKFFLNYLYFLCDEWQAGRTFTHPFYLEGIDHIQPHSSTRFTKPILLLTNALDMSGGDFLPAILQDNKRATIFGERTAGAGGYVSAVQFPNLNGIMSFHLTESIAERVDRSFIENIGVVPDISYKLSTYDLQYGYGEYKEAVLNALSTILDP